VKYSVLKNATTKYGKIGGVKTLQVGGGGHKAKDALNMRKKPTCTMETLATQGTRTCVNSAERNY